MSGRWNSKKVVEAINGVGDIPTHGAVSVGGRLIREASATARGKRTPELVGKGDALDIELSPVSSSGGNVPPAVRVMALLGRMGQLAARGTSRSVDEGERSAMGKELARLSQQIDRIATQITRTVPTGEVPANYDSVEAFFESIFADETLDGLLDPFSSYSLGVDSKSISVASPSMARSAREAIDDALQEMRMIQQNGASTEAHLDAALNRLAAYVATIEPGTTVPAGPEEALQAAEMVRLYLMNGRGISPLGSCKDLQQSVTALLQ